MEFSQIYNFALARAKALDGQQVVGYAHIMDFTGREHFYSLFVPQLQKEVYVDPMTVEFFTGMRDAIQPERRIFEGDVLLFFSMNGTAINAGANDFFMDHVCEICMPLQLSKVGASKRLYLHDTVATPEASQTDGFYEIGDQFDMLEWNVIGHVDDKDFDTGIGRRFKIRVLKGMGHETATDNSPGRGSRVWGVANSDDPRDKKVCKFFGTMKRRQHIIRRLFERDFYKNHILRYHPEFEALVPKWKDEYKRYYRAYQEKEE